MDPVSVNHASSAAPVPSPTQQPAEGSAGSDGVPATPLQRAAGQHLEGEAQPARARPALPRLVIPGGANVDAATPPQAANPGVGTPHPGNRQDAIQTGLQLRAAAALDSPHATIQNLFAATQAPTPILPGAPQNDRFEETPKSVLNSQLIFNEPRPGDQNSPRA